MKVPTGSGVKNNISRSQRKQFSALNTRTMINHIQSKCTDRAWGSVLNAFGAVGPCRSMSVAAQRPPTANRQPGTDLALEISARKILCCANTIPCSCCRAASCGRVGRASEERTRPSCAQRTRRRARQRVDRRNGGGVSPREAPAASRPHWEASPPHAPGATAERRGPHAPAAAPTPPITLAGCVRSQFKVHGQTPAWRVGFSVGVARPVQGVRK